MKKSRGVVSEKEKVSKKIMHLAKDCKNLAELSEAMSKLGLEPYSRNGILTGVWFRNKKFRLTTIGVGKEHLKEMSREQKRLEGLHKKPQIRNEKEQE